MGDGKGKKEQIMGRELNILILRSEKSDHCWWELTQETKA